MSRRITDQVLDDLRTLEKVKDDLIKKIEEEKRKMKEFRATIPPQDEEQHTTSSRMAKKARNIDPGTMSAQDVLDTYELNIHRLQKSFEEKNKEALGLRKILESSSDHTPIQKE